MSTSLEILKVRGQLLTRIEHNSDSLASVKRVLLYNHGFPDSSVTPNALNHFTQREPGAPISENGYFSSRLPRKLCEVLLKKMPDTAFVAFNTMGIPGSTENPPDRLEDPPPEFITKTLSGDMKDISHVFSFLRSERFPDAQMCVCGMSTGAFLALAFAAREDLHPEGGLESCFVMACVDDIPSSVNVDFDTEQLAEADREGSCSAKFFPYELFQYGAADNPQKWRLGRAYIESYKDFPPMPELAAKLKIPVLLIHGEDDKHVPCDHADRLLGTLQEHMPLEGLRGRARVLELSKIPKGNHFFSSNQPFAKVVAASSTSSRGLTLQNEQA
eukprot:CAMPEP_0171999664 /NCGR_PEP_ID=MMETSP1041-20130122/1902_1 /TAXON_ID=464988 /ORGANISM="Hemiselmis andersenii, Strain CCMP439" /LENGTH=329 /DNA_ID=CAMNT_0012653143 /DNA_START=247 /DNA_END=1233 /DNA_ORIENTATION=+